MKSRMSLNLILQYHLGRNRVCFISHVPLHIHLRWNVMEKHLYKQIIPASSSIISHHKTVHRTTRDGCRWEYSPSRIWPRPYTKLDPFETYHVDMMCIPGILAGLRKVPSSWCLPAVGRMVHYPMICLFWKGFNNLLDNKANTTHISWWKCYKLSEKCWLIFTPHISPASTIIDN